MTSKAKNILLVDDSPFFRTKINDILTDEGHRVILAKDGREAISMLRENPDDIDLLTLDLNMPHVDGFGVLEWMKENACSGAFPVLVVTGSRENAKVLERLKSLGADGFMTKACSYHHVINSVNKMLFSNGVNTRKEPRMHLRAMVEYSQEGMTYIGSTLDISTTGVLMHVRRYIPVDTELGLKFSLPDTDRVFDIKGIVKWSSPTRFHKKLFDGVGIIFTSISDGEKDEIKHFVEGEDKTIQLDE